MSFSFGLFRFLTYGNLFVVGFLVLIVLMAILIMPGAGAALISLMMMVVVFCHNILCLQLQKATTNPDVVLTRNFMSFIVLLSVLSFIYSMFVFSGLFSMLFVSEADFMKMVDASSMKGGEKPTVEMISAIRKVTIVLVGIHGLAIAVNCVLSSVFLNKWKKQQTEKEETTLDI